MRRPGQCAPAVDGTFFKRWEAVIPEPEGAQRWVLRYELHELLDEVERRLAASAGEPGVIEREPDREA